MNKTIAQVARIVAETLERVAPGRELTRITIMQDAMMPDANPQWWRVVMGVGSIGVTDAIDPIRLNDLEDVQMFVERLLSRLDHALAAASTEQTT